VTETEKTAGAIALVKQFVPELIVTKKFDSRLHKAIGWILAKVGNKSYMESYATTIGTTIATPTQYNLSWTTALHEGRHGLDFKKWGHLFSIGYLFPQILGIVGVLLSLVACVCVLCGASPWLLLVLTSLAFLAPLPAPFRALAEIRGYTITLATLFWSNRIEDEQLVLRALVEVFVGPGYYWMWPFKSLVRKHFQKQLDALKADEFEQDAYLAACRVYALVVKEC
jgi:hypothetical protein